MQGTPGAELHPDLDRSRIDVVVDKGQDPGTEGYSGFDGTELATLLRERGIDAVTVVGLATDYCVRATALEAAQAGFAVTVVADATRAVDVQPGDGAARARRAARRGRHRRLDAYSQGFLSRRIVFRVNRIAMATV